MHRRVAVGGVVVGLGMLSAVGGVFAWGADGDDDGGVTAPAATTQVWIDVEGVPEGAHLGGVLVTPGGPRALELDPAPIGLVDVLATTPGNHHIEWTIDRESSISVVMTFADTSGAILEQSTRHIKLLPPVVPTPTGPSSPSPSTSPSPTASPTSRPSPTVSPTPPPSSPTASPTAIASPTPVASPTEAGGVPAGATPTAIAVTTDALPRTGSVLAAGFIVAGVGGVGLGWLLLVRARRKAEL